MYILDDKEEELKRAFLNYEKHLIRPTIQTQAYIGEVDKANWMTSVYFNTPTAKGKPEKVYYYNIPLKVIYNSSNQASILEIPKADSICIVSFMYGSEQCLRLVSVQEINEYIWLIGGQKLNVSKDGFVFNNGTNGGMVLVEELVKAYNNVVSDMTTIKKALAKPCANGVPLDPAFIPNTTTKSASYFANEKVKQ
jgi:hypothetical protein